MRKPPQRLLDILSAVLLVLAAALARRDVVFVEGAVLVLALHDASTPGLWEVLVGDLVVVGVLAALEGDEVASHVAHCGGVGEWRMFWELELVEGDLERLSEVLSMGFWSGLAGFLEQSMIERCFWWDCRSTYALSLAAGLLVMFI